MKIRYNCGMRLLALALALAPLGARADESPAPAEEKAASQASHFLQAGVRLYERGEFDAAKDQLHRAETANDATNEDIIKTQVYLGLVAEQLGDTGQAERNFQAALALDPWAHVPKGASPKQREQIAQIRRHLYGNKIPPPPHRASGEPKIKVTLPTGETSEDKK